MSSRMTAVSRENIKQADLIQIFQFDSDGFGIRICRDDRVAFATGGDGFVMLYKDVVSAARAISRLRPGWQFAIYSLT